MKKNIKVIVAFILGILVTGTIVYAESVISGSQVSYQDHVGLGSTNVQGAIDKIYEKATVIKQGDYIRLTPTASTYSIPASETGYSAAQTINPSELTLWRVISVNTDGIEVVSDQVSSDVIYFGQTLSNTSTITTDNVNVVAYRKFVKILNMIAAQYTDGVHVKATRHMGYDSILSTEEITTTTSLISTTVPWIGSTGKNGIIQESLGGGDLGYNTDYNLVKKVYGNGKANKVRTTEITAYWLASRSYDYYSSTNWGFDGRYVGVSGSVYDGYFYNYNNSNFYFNSYYKAIRPIITLNPDVVISGGSGKESDPYTLA